MEQLIKVQTIFEIVRKSPTVENVNLLQHHLVQLNWQAIPHMLRYQDIYLQCLITQITETNTENTK